MKPQYLCWVCNNIFPKLYHWLFVTQNHKHWSTLRTSVSTRPVDTKYHQFFVPRFSIDPQRLFAPTHHRRLLPPAIKQQVQKHQRPVSHILDFSSHSAPIGCANSDIFSVFHKRFQADLSERRIPLHASETINFVPLSQKMIPIQVTSNIYDFISKPA